MGYKLLVLLNALPRHWALQMNKQNIISGFSVNHCANETLRFSSGQWKEKPLSCHLCPILSTTFQWTKPGVQWSLVEKWNRKYSRVHLNYRNSSHDKTGSVNNTLRRVGKSSDDKKAARYCFNVIKWFLGFTVNSYYNGRHWDRLWVSVL